MSETMITKQCSKCKQVKPTANFRKNSTTHDHLQCWCKECQKERANEYKHTKGYSISKGRYRRSLKNKIAQDRYNKSDKGKTTRLQNVKKYQARNPEKLRAQHAVNHQIEQGNIIKASFYYCFMCSENKATQYHHYNGYNKVSWFQIIPVCTKCHKAIHKFPQIAKSILFRPKQNQLQNLR